jgi:ATP-binding cassette subfamily F protein 3
MINLRQVTIRRGIKVILEDADVDMYDGQKIGIIGPNGVGKSSMFQTLLGQLPPDKGEVEIPSNCSLAHLKQELPHSDLSAIDYALLGDTIYAERKAELDASENSDDGMAIAHAHAMFGEIDGYSAAARSAKILIGLGFTQEQLLAPVNSFSGGWRMRLNLAQVLLSRADMLLLDEPTNHLDLEGIIWLGDWIRSAECMVLVISHDREFLDEVATHIVQFKDRKLKKYTGNYSSYEREYTQQMAIQQAAHAKQQKHRAHLQSFIDRFGAKASKAKQAQSREKMLKRMVEIAPIHEDSQFRFEFADNICGVNPMLALDQVTVGYDKKPILHDLNFSLRDGDRIGLLGLNGAGKSTFVKLLANQLTVMDGHVQGSSKIKIGYFAQHQLDLLDPEATMMTQFKRLDEKITESQARNFLGGFNFTGSRVFEHIGNFSGGEKSRLVLALLVWQKPNLLLLDEPTNHLDMDMREALMMALQTFQGSMILVSHDRYLLNCLVDEYWLVDNGKVERFDGDLDDYRRWLKDRENNLQAPKPTPVAAPKRQQDTGQSEKKIEKYEQKLAALQAQLASVEVALADPQLYQAPGSVQLNKLQQQGAQLKAEIAKFEHEILKIIEEEC